MARFTLIGTASIPGQGSELRLSQRNDEFSIKIAGKPGELMNTRLHGSPRPPRPPCARKASSPSGPPAPTRPLPSVCGGWVLP